MVVLCCDPRGKTLSIRHGLGVGSKTELGVWPLPLRVTAFVIPGCAFPSGHPPAAWKNTEGTGGVPAAHAPG